MAGTWIDDWEEWDAITQCEQKAFNLAASLQRQLDRYQRDRCAPPEALRRELLEAARMLRLAEQARENFIAGLVSEARIVH